MGTWGPGVFENDTACDWFECLERDRNLQIVEYALGAVLSRRTLNIRADDAEKALAACEVIACVQGDSGERSVHAAKLESWVASHKPEVSPRLARMAVAAIGFILSEPSGIYNTWYSDDDFVAWKSNVEKLKLC